MIPRLLKTHTLQFTSDAVDGYYDDGGNWGDPEPSDPFDVKGNIQPFIMGWSQRALPEGSTAIDARIFYSVTNLTPTDERLGVIGDKTIIDGIPFRVYHKMDWTGYGTRIQHYKYILVREDKINVS